MTGTLLDTSQSIGCKLGGNRAISVIIQCSYLHFLDEGTEGSEVHSFVPNHTAYRWKSQQLLSSLSHSEAHAFYQESKNKKGE